MCFTTNPQSVNKDVLAKFINVVIKVLNDNNALPRIMAIIPDWDILRYIYDGKGHTKKVASTVLKWLVGQIDKAIQAKISCKRKNQEPFSVGSQR